MLIRDGEGDAERRRRKLTVGDAVGNDLNGEALGVADRVFAGLAIAHYARQFEGFCDPAPVFLPIKFDRQIHAFIIPSEKRLLASILDYTPENAAPLTNSS